MIFKTTAQQVSTSNSLIKAFDDDVIGVLTTICKKNSTKWRAIKKQVMCMREIDCSFSVIADLIGFTIGYAAVSFLRHCICESVGKSAGSGKTIDEMQSLRPIASKSVNTTVCDSYYTALYLICKRYRMTPPIILYGRLFEDEQFQYVCFIFGNRVFIMELTTYNVDVQERACETMCALIRLSGGVPKDSSFIKILQSIAHVVAEIDIHNESFSFCELAPVDFEILNLNELMALINASHYLSKKPRAQIEDIYAQTLIYKHPFLEGFHVNKNRIFGCVHRSEYGAGSSVQRHITLVFCDTVTQSNFLWNERPVTVTVKQLMVWRNNNCVTTKMPYRQLELLPSNVVSHSIGRECGGIRFGDEILYDGPFVIVLD